MLRDYVTYHKITDITSKLFSSSEKISEHWREFRNIAYTKFKDMELLLKIRLYDLRHWFATTIYLKTRDIFYVKYALGHRDIQSTLVYMHIAKGLVNYSDEYTVNVATSIDECTKLLEIGFEYVTDFEGKKLFRKRK